MITNITKVLKLYILIDFFILSTHTYMIIYNKIYLYIKYIYFLRLIIFILLKNEQFI